MTKDRFKELQENIEKYGDGVDISILNHFAIIDMEGPFMGDFFSQVDTLRLTIDKITRLMDDVERLQHAMLTSVITPGTKERLEEKMNEIKSLGHHIRKKINQMKQIKEIQNITARKNVRQRIIESQIDGITKQFCTTMDKYYQSVITYREKCKQRVHRQVQRDGIEVTDDEIEEILENGALIMCSEIRINTEQARQRLDMMELRHQELIKLEDNIQEVHDMLFDVAHLVTSHNDNINDVLKKVRDAEDFIPRFIPSVRPNKVSRCFDVKLSRKRFASSPSSLVSRLFPSCI